MKQPSHLAAAARLAAAGLRRRGAPEADPPKAPTRKLAVERRWIESDSGRVARYLVATRGRAASDVTRSGATLPPTYSAVWETALILELLAMPGVPFPSAGLVHVQGEVVVLRPLRMGEHVRCRVELDRLETAVRGTRLSLKCRSWNSADQLCQENTTELLVLRPNQRAAGGNRSEPAEPGGVRAGPRAGLPDGEDELARWSVHSEWELPGDAGLRYARASGDFNPIHLWPWTSRLFGFSRPILHGHCSMAMIAHELAGGLEAGPVSGLRTISAAFRSPLTLPARVRLLVAEEQGEGLAFRLVETHDVEHRKPYVAGRYVGRRENLPGLASES